MAHQTIKQVITDKWGNSLKFRISHWVEEGGTEIATALVVETGMAHMQISFTPADLWSLADKLTEAATEAAHAQSAAAILKAEQVGA